MLSVGLTVAVIGLAACGDDARDAGTAPDVEASTPPATESGEAILINTRISFVEEPFTGEVLNGSSIGDSPLCPSGTFSDQHGNDEIGSVDRTFSCPEGRLRIGFTPGEPQGQTQSGPWKILSGTGAFEELQGSGQMEVTYDPDNDMKGSERFTGTIAR
ncbi:MAG: hypothetical protein WD627_08395 [Actinomycetota bacterium]